MSTADPTVALVEFLRATSDVVALLGDAGKIYRPRLPDSVIEAKVMPMSCVVVSPAGGYARWGDSYIPWIDPRLAVRCYGGSELDADDLGREVAKAIRGLRRGVWGGALLHDAAVVGPQPLIEPDTDWPLAFLTAKINMAEDSVA